MWVKLLILSLGTSILAQHCQRHKGFLFIDEICQNKNSSQEVFTILSNLDYIATIHLQNYFKILNNGNILHWNNRHHRKKPNGFTFSWCKSLICLSKLPKHKHKNWQQNQHIISLCCCFTWWLMRWLLWGKQPLLHYTSEQEWLQNTISFFPSMSFVYTAIQVCVFCSVKPNWINMLILLKHLRLRGNEEWKWKNVFVWSIEIQLKLKNK